MPIRPAADLIGLRKPAMVEGCRRPDCRGVLTTRSCNVAGEVISCKWLLRAIEARWDQKAKPVALQKIHEMIMKAGIERMIINDANHLLANTPN